MRKIAFIMQHLDNAAPPVENGSVAIWIYNAATELAQARQDYAVCVYGVQPNLFETRVLRYKNVTYYFLPALPHYIWEKVTRLLLAFKLFFKGRDRAKGRPELLFAGTCALGYILPIAWHLRHNPCDIIHISNFTQFVPVIRFFNRRQKIVLHMHCEWVSQLPKTVIAPRLAKTDLIIGCSSYITGKIRTAYPAYRGQLLTVHNGVNVNHFQPGLKRRLPVEDSNGQAGREIRLLFVGRISPEKGVHTLIEAFNKLITGFAAVRLDIIGDERMLPRHFIVELSKQANVKSLARFYINTDNRGYASTLRKMLVPAAKPYVNFLGPVPHTQLACYYRQADILINPSLSESFGMSLIEALACGLVVVATRVGGMSDIIEHGKTGILINPESPGELAEAIGRLITNRPLFNSLRQAGRLHCIHQFSWPGIAGELQAAYTKLITGS